MKQKVNIEEPVKARTYRLLLYPDNPKHNLAIIELCNSPYAVGILHDNDVYEQDDEETDDSNVGEKKKSHYHFVLKFSNPRYKSGVANSLDIEERFVFDCDNFKGAVRYLTHIDYPDKYQYDKANLIGGLKSSVLKYFDDEPEDFKIIQILNYIDDYNGYLKTRDLTLWCCQNGYYSALRRSGWIIRDILVEQHEKFFILHKK